MRLAALAAVCCFRAEDVYTLVLRDDADAMPGACGWVRWTADGRELTAEWEIRANAVWRRGRLFLRCPRCADNAPRL